MESQDNLSHFAAVFPCSDMDQSLKFYHELLGFDITFQWNNPVDYAVLKRGGVSIHLTKRTDGLSSTTHHNILYIFVHEIDSFYDELMQREVPIHNPIGDREYGMRDFDIKDPEGYILTFGKGN